MSSTPVPDTKTMLADNSATSMCADFARVGNEPYFAGHGLACQKGAPISCLHQPPVSALVQPLLRPQAAEAADIRQREGEAEQVFVAHIGHGVAAVFHGHAAAVPVIGGLCADELQRLVLGVKTETAGGAEARLGEAAVSQSCAKLVEAQGLGRRGP